MLYCKPCNKEKPLEEFHKDSKSNRGRAYYCKDCANRKTREYHTKNVGKKEYLDKKWDSYYRCKYGISLEQRKELLKGQGGCCAICKISLEEHGSNTHTDHCHDTGKVRAILCTNCNRGLGHFMDNEKNLLSAIEYLRKHTVNGTQKEGCCQ